MLSINGDEIQIDDTNYFKLATEYARLSGAVYKILVEQIGKEKAQDLMLHQIVRMVSIVENTEE